MKNISHIVDRLKNKFGFKSDSEVAESLKMTKTALYNHKLRGTIPYGPLSTFCEINNISLDWLLTGVGPMERTPQVGEEMPSFNEVSDVTKLIVKVLQDMPEDDQREILKRILKKRNCYRSF